MGMRQHLGRTLLTLWTSLAAAESALTADLRESLQIHGFAAQAAIKTSNNRWFGPSDGTSFDFTEIGLNASFRPLPRLLLAGQILSRRAGAMADGTPAVDFALADVELWASPEHRAGLRLGRLKNPLGLYNETRDIPFTHPGIFLPQVVYFDRVRNLVLATDGAGLYGAITTPVGNLALNLLHGQAVVDENVEWTYLNTGFPGDLQPDGNSWLASLWFRSPAERLKLGLSGAILDLRFHPDHSAPYSPGAGTVSIHYWIASAQYSAQTWTLTAEYAGEPLQWRDFGAFPPDRSIRTEGYYVQGTWRPYPPVELMLRYQEGFADRRDRDGRDAEASTNGLIPHYTLFSRIAGVGIRWDITPHWMVRADYERHQGTFILSTRENRDPGRLAEHWDMLGLQLVFRF
jgi:hypothetical protein